MFKASSSKQVSMEAKAKPFTNLYNKHNKETYSTCVNRLI